MHLPGVSKNEIKKCRNIDEGLKAIELSLTDEGIQAGMFLLVVIDYYQHEESCLDFIK